MKLVPKNSPEITVTSLRGVKRLENEKGQVWYVPERYWSAVTNSDDPYKVASRPPVSWHPVHPDYHEAVLTEGYEALHRDTDMEGNYSALKPSDLIDNINDQDGAIYFDSYDHTFWSAESEYPLSVPVRIEIWGKMYDLESMREYMDGHPWVLDYSVDENQTVQNWSISGRMRGSALVQLPQDQYDKLAQWATENVSSYRDGVPGTPNMKEILTWESDHMPEGLRDLLGIAKYRVPEDDDYDEASWDDY
jgi:hypothetical protein